ncbi:thioredoxin domain-containing protein [Anaeromyxobacter paludicola]|nr:hypothetical protein [Anaeromyxobacter paludicola]
MPQIFFAQIFFGDRAVGGYEELQELDRRGGLRTAAAAPTEG